MVRLVRGLVCWLGALLAGAALGGCFFYDSSWGAAKASQKRVAAQRMPSELKHELPTRTAERFRIRAYATPHYAAALVDGEAQFVQALADANPTLASALSFRLELSDYRVWSNGASDDSLATLLDAIERQDPADDVDWVVILASPRHMVATSADELGMAPLLGRHLAIRAMSDAAEFDVIERSFTELSDDEKHELYMARKRHKAASALHRQAAQAALDVLHRAPDHTFEDQGVRAVEALLQRHGESSAPPPPCRPAPLRSRLRPRPVDCRRSTTRSSSGPNRRKPPATFRERARWPPRYSLAIPPATRCRSSAANWR